MKSSEWVRGLLSAKEEMVTEKEVLREVLGVCGALRGVVLGVGGLFAGEGRGDGWMLVMGGGRVGGGAEVWMEIVPSILSFHLSVQVTSWNRLLLIMNSIASQIPQMRNRAVVAAPVVISTSSYPGTLYVLGGCHWVKSP